MKKFFFLAAFFICCGSFPLNAQDLPSKIKIAVADKNYQTAISFLSNLEKSDVKTFTVNNYDYLQARMGEKSNDLALAISKYQQVAERNSILSEYALWHLSQISRFSGNLVLERIYLQKILAFSAESFLTEAVNKRLARSYFESKNYETTITLLQKQTYFSGKSLSAASDKTQKTNLENQIRENLVLHGESQNLINQTSLRASNI